MLSYIAPIVAVWYFCIRPDIGACLADQQHRWQISCHCW